MRGALIWFHPDVREKLTQNSGDLKVLGMDKTQLRKQLYVRKNNTTVYANLFYELKRDYLTNLLGMCGREKWRTIFGLQTNLCVGE